MLVEGSSFTNEGSAQARAADRFAGSNPGIRSAFSLGLIDYRVCRVLPVREKPWEHGVSAPMDGLG